MSRTEDIDNGIWDDPEFADLSPFATLLYLWSWTNPRCGMAGIYKVPIARMTECKVPAENLEAALHELSESGFLFYEDGVLWVRARVKRLRVKTSQMAKSIAKDLENLPASHPLKHRFVAMYGDVTWLRESLTGLSLDSPVNVTKKPVPKPNQGTFTGTSPEVPGSMVGVGEEEEALEQPHPERSPLPSDFPEELRPHLRLAYRTLTDLAARRDAKAVAPMALANVVMARRRKPIVRAAHDCAAYWDGKSSGPRDVVAAYRNWLDKTDDLAALERLDGDGQVASVAPLSERQQRQERRRAALDRLTTGDAA